MRRRTSGSADFPISEMFSIACDSSFTRFSRIAGTSSVAISKRSCPNSPRSFAITTFLMVDSLNPPRGVISPPTSLRYASMRVRVKSTTFSLLRLASIRRIARISGSSLRYMPGLPLPGKEVHKPTRKPKAYRHNHQQYEDSQG